MTSEDPRADDSAGDDPDPNGGPSTSDEPASDDGPGSNGDASDRSGRPLLGGAIGLVAGVAGGIAGTTFAPNSLFLTIALVIGVGGLVTLGALRLLARR